MQRSIGRDRIGATLLTVALVIGVACRDATSPDSGSTPPPPPQGKPSTADTTKPAAPSPGAYQVHVTIVTSGTDPDPDGYTLVVNGATQAVRINDALDVTPHDSASGISVLLDGLAGNCATDSTALWRFGGLPAPGLHVTFTVTCVGPSIPPGMAGKQLLFVRGGQIYRAAVGSSSAIALTTGDEPTWSPDGKRIAFIRGADVYVMDADGTNQRIIATGTIEYPEWQNYLGGLAPAWSPDGTRLALFSGGGLTIVPVDSIVAPASLDMPSWAVSEAPTWSPDGKRIAFANDLDSWGGVEVLGIGIGDVAGSSLTNVTWLTLNPPAALSSWPIGSYTEPAWSPDGRSIALLACSVLMPHAYQCGDGAIAVMNTDGSKLRVLAHTRGLSRPGWSSDGNSIIYANDCWDHKCPSAVMWVSADGSTRGVLVDDAYSPSLSR